MMTIRPCDFWVADIPFTNGSASQKRPILVLWLDGDDVVVAALGFAEEDAVIVACAGWIVVECLISENRHFLERLGVAPFAIINAETALSLP
jgi:hypothetical protein